MMIFRKNFSIILLVSFSLSLLFTSVINTAYAAQTSSKEQTLQNKPRTISGKVTDVITVTGVTYAEIDTGKEKVWAAGAGVTPLKIGDTVAFSTEMPMQNYYSKTLGRDFSLIYFVREYITDKKTSTTAAPQGQHKQQQINKPIKPAYKGTSGEVRVGGYLREATLNGLNGKNKKFSDFKGKPLIINVWASWCGPCRAEMGSLERLAKRYNEKEFNVIGISTDDYRNKAEAFIKQTGITFENFLDSKLRLENMLGAKAIPLTILVDDQGRVLEKVRGTREWDDPKIIEAIGRAFNIKLMH